MSTRTFAHRVTTCAALADRGARGEARKSTIPQESTTTMRMRQRARFTSSRKASLCRGCFCSEETDHHRVSRLAGPTLN